MTCPASLLAQTTGVSRLEAALGARLRHAVPQHRLPLEGVRRTADFAYPGRRLAVFVDGCFWHGHGHSAVKPGYWSEKVARNAARDRDTDLRLAAIGWRSIRVWECELRAAAKPV